MNFSPEVLKQLLATFQEELAEGANVIINGLLELEKYDTDSENRAQLIENIFRIAHNLKGASRGLGITHVGDIAHHLESIFTVLKISKTSVARNTIDVCLESVDKMQSAMQSFVNKTELNFDINELIKRMELCEKQADTNHKDIKTPATKNQIANKSKKIKDTQSHEKSMITDSIRVSIKVIDKLSALSEEIQGNKIQLDDYIFHTKNLEKALTEFISSWNDVASSIVNMTDSEEHVRLKKTFQNTHDKLTQVSSALYKISNDISFQSHDYSRLSRSIQHEVALLRLVPAQNILNLLPRYVRTLSTELNKQVELDIIGGDVNIDKQVLEGLKDPINHLLRNAIDHGIESKDIRAKKGKPAIGKITLDIKTIGNQIQLQISDDGAGLDYDSIKNKITSTHPEYADKINSLTETEIQNFIFQPGFSTSQKITDISGRGVGLDVVKKNIQALKGTLSIKSQPGLGTTFIIVVPSSLLSEHGVIVECAGERFVLPTANIDRIQQIKNNEIIHLTGHQAILIDNHPILLKRLSDVLAIHRNVIDQSSFPVVIVTGSNTVVAFAVDQIIGEREIVIKPIQAPLTHVPCIAGATLVDRTRVVLVLNPNELIDLSLSTLSQPLITEMAELEKNIEITNVLVVDDSITTRTVEKNILESKNYHVTTAVNGKEAWDLLQKQPFSLIITDINMPMMDGIELTERIKKSDKFSHLPVIIVTSIDSDEEKAKGMKAGADAYLVKNEFESSKLLEIIKQLV